MYMKKYLFLLPLLFPLQGFAKEEFHHINIFDIGFFLSSAWLILFSVFFIVSVVLCIKNRKKDSKKGDNQRLLLSGILLTISLVIFGAVMYVKSIPLPSGACPQGQDCFIYHASSEIEEGN